MLSSSGDASSAASYESALAHTRSYVEEHVRLATAIGKPLIIEEFGMARDSQRADDAPHHTLRRDGLFAELLRLGAEHRGVVSGVMPWAWSGRGRPRRTGDGAVAAAAAAAPAPVYWRRGDELLGDPPHEPQGW